MVSARLMFGTSSERVPSGLGRSIAMPRLTWAGTTTLGLPSGSAYDTFWLGNTLSVCTIAQPMRWVNETLPPRARRRWLLMTIRLSIINLAGTVRTLVAVGMLRLASMLAARVLLTPRSGVTVSSAGAASWPSTTGTLEVCGASAGIGCGLAGADVVRAIGVDAVVGAGSDGAGAGCSAAGVSAAGVSTGSAGGDWTGIDVVGVGSVCSATGW